MTNKRIIHAFAFAPLAALSLYVCLLLFDPDPTEHIWDKANIILLGYVALVVYSAELLLGVPAYLTVRKLNWNSLGTYMLGGLIIAFISALFLDLPNINLQRSDYYVISSIAGILSSSLFWIIIKKDLKIKTI